MSLDTIRRGVPGAASAALIARRARGAYDIDEWGLDPELVSLANPVFALRWDIDVEGAEGLPAVGGAVLVFNRRFGVSEPWVVARGVRQACGRFVRTVGAPDVAGIGPFLRRFGGVLDRTDEIAGLLRAGQLVGLPMARGLRSREHAGLLEVARIQAAIDASAPVVPVALVGRESGRNWRLVVGEPMRPRRDAGPLAAAELAEDTRRAVQVLLDDALPTAWWF
jgi:hypothetical protein